MKEKAEEEGTNLKKKKMQPVDKKTKLVKGASVDRERRRRWRRQTSTLASSHHFYTYIIIVRYRAKVRQTYIYIPWAFLYEEVVKDLYSSVMMNLYFSSVIIYIFARGVTRPAYLAQGFYLFILNNFLKKLLFVAYFVVDYFFRVWILAIYPWDPVLHSGIFWEVHSRAPPSDRFQGQILTLCYSEIFFFFFFRPELPFRFLLLKRGREFLTVSLLLLFKKSVERGREWGLHVCPSSEEGVTLLSLGGGMDSYIAYTTLSKVEVEEYNVMLFKVIDKFKVNEVQRRAHQGYNRSCSSWYFEMYFLSLREVEEGQGQVVYLGMTLVFSSLC